jgi:hypothetical protein
VYSFFASSYQSVERLQVIERAFNNNRGYNTVDIGDTVYFRCKHKHLEKFGLPRNDYMLYNNKYTYLKAKLILANKQSLLFS